MNSAEFQANTPYAQFGTYVIDAPVDARRAFIRKTYTHLAAAIYAFVALEWLLFSIGADQWIMTFLGNTPFAWLIVLGAFMVVSWVADSWARSATSPAMQYAGLFLYVLAEAVIFLPLISLSLDAAVTFDGVGTVGVLPAAAVTTLVIFGGLTAITFVTKKDFSFLRGFLGIAMFAAIALIIISAFTGFHLGIWFSWLMVVAASGYILYYTSNIIHHYRPEQYVAASLALFASVALLFWYVLQIFLANRD